MKKFVMECRMSMIFVGLYRRASRVRSPDAIHPMMVWPALCTCQLGSRAREKSYMPIWMAHLRMDGTLSNGWHTYEWMAHFRMDGNTIIQLARHCMCLEGKHAYILQLQSIAYKQI